MKNIYEVTTGQGGTFKSALVIGRKEAQMWLDRETYYLTKREREREESTIDKIGNFADLKEHLESMSYDSDTIGEAIDYLKRNGCTDGFDWR